MSNITKSTIENVVESVDQSDDIALHQLGLDYAACGELGKALCIKKALIVWQAKRIFCRRGRGSQMTPWLRRYAPDLDRKQADRLSNIVEFFTGGNSDKLSELETVLERFKLTALYRLASQSIPAAAREAAVAHAKAGAEITPALAQELIDEHTLPRLSGPTKTRGEGGRKRKSTTISLEGGSRVVVRAEDGDFLRALKAAITEFKKHMPDTQP